MVTDGMLLAGLLIVLVFVVTKVYSAACSLQPNRGLLITRFCVAQSVVNSNTWPDVYGYGEHMLGSYCLQ